MARPSNLFFKGLYQLWLVPDDDSDADLQILGAYDALAQAMLAKAAAEQGITDDSIVEVTKRVDVFTHYEDVSSTVNGTAQNRSIG